MSLLFVSWKVLDDIKTHYEYGTNNELYYSQAPCMLPFSSPENKCGCMKTMYHRYGYNNCVTSIFTYIFVVNPLVEVTAVTGGCGYVSARWAAIGIISELCKTVQYNVTLSAIMNVSMPILTTANFHNFTGLPDDTLYDVTLFGHTVFGLFSNIEVTAVKTMSTYVCT